MTASMPKLSIVLLLVACAAGCGGDAPKSSSPATTVAEKKADSVDRVANTTASVAETDRVEFGSEGGGSTAEIDIPVFPSASEVNSTSIPGSENVPVLIAV